MPRAPHVSRARAGLTLVELMLVLGAIGVLAALAMPAFHGHRERVRSAEAATHIRGLSILAKSFRSEFSAYPPRLAMVSDQPIPLDPWGNAYQYLPIEGAPAADKGSQRKDKNLVPINSDFDLYSFGADGESQPPLTAKPSHDDIVRAADGAYVGLASDY